MQREKFIDEMVKTAEALAIEMWADAKSSDHVLLLESVPKETLPAVYDWNREHPDLKINISRVCMSALRKALLKKKALLIDMEMEE